MDNLFKNIDTFLKQQKGETNIQKNTVSNQINNATSNNNQENNQEEEQKPSDESLKQLLQIKPQELTTAESNNIVNVISKRSKNYSNIRKENEKNNKISIDLITYAEFSLKEKINNLTLEPITSIYLTDANINNFFYFARKYKADIPLYEEDKDEYFTNNGNFVFFLQNKLGVNRRPNNLNPYGIYVRKGSNNVKCNIFIDVNEDGKMIDCDNSSQNPHCESKACDATINKIDIYFKEQILDKKKKEKNVYSLKSEIFDETKIKEYNKQFRQQTSIYKELIEVSNDYRMIINARKTILIHQIKMEAFKVYKCLNTTNMGIYRALIEEKNNGGSNKFATYSIRRPAYTKKEKICSIPKKRTLRKKKTRKTKLSNS